MRETVNEFIELFKEVKQVDCDTTVYAGRILKKGGQGLSLFPKLEVCISILDYYRGYASDMPFSSTPKDMLDNALYFAHVLHVQGLLEDRHKQMVSKDMMADDLYEFSMNLPMLTNYDASVVFSYLSKFYFDCLKDLRAARKILDHEKNDLGLLLSKGVVRPERVKVCVHSSHLWNGIFYKNPTGLAKKSVHNMVALSCDDFHFVPNGELSKYPELKKYEARCNQARSTEHDRIEEDSWEDALKGVVRPY